jgi:hypothetical protein
MKKQDWLQCYLYHRGSSLPWLKNWCTEQKQATGERMDIIDAGMVLDIRYSGHLYRIR